MLSVLKRFLRWLELIKFAHTVFALPFALASMLVAAHGMPSWAVFAWILICMTGARTAAMAFNRFIDWEFDKHNPRTVGRSRLASKHESLMLCLLGLLVFFFGVAQLPSLCLWLSPLMLFLLFGYSLAKRFTAHSHALLGLALAAAPMGAWAAVTGSLMSPLPWVLAAAVLTWVWGFDLIYATQDIDFDRKAGLYSFPSKYGFSNALLLAKILHALTWILLFIFGQLAQLRLSYTIALVIIALGLLYEHWLSRTGDVANINKAFFEVNSAVGMALLLGVGFGLK